MMRRIDVRSMALGLSLVLALAACGALISDEERVDLARSQLAAGDTQTAVIHLKNVLQADPSNVSARVLLAEASFAAGDFESAAKEYLRAVDLGAELDSLRLPLVEALVRAGGLQEVLRLTDPVAIGDVAELAYWRALALGQTGHIAEARTLLEAMEEPVELHQRAQVALARLALAEQRADEALGLLQPLGGAMAASADYWEVLGIASLRAGRPDDAAAAFQTAADVVVDPLGQRQFMLRSGEAESLLAAGRLDEARQLVESLLGQSERHPIANYLMARVELQSGDAAQALAYAQAMLAAEPDSSTGFMMAGAASLSLGQTVQAERYLERAIASDPGNTPARKLLAQTRLGLQSPERALEALGPGLAAGSDPAVAALAGVASVRAGDPEAAIEIFRRQLEADPGNEEARSLLAVSLMSAGRTEEALAELAQIKSGQGVMRQRADLIGIAAHLQGNDVPAARALARQAAAAHPGDTAMLNALGALFEGAGQLDDATTWFEESLSVEPGNNAAAFNLGRIAANQGQLDRSRELFTGILAREPGNAAALTSLAQIEWAQDRREEAVAALERARTADPADGGSRFVLTQYLVATGRAAEAVDVAREAVAISPASAPIVNALGVALLEAGNPADALPQFARALQVNPAEARYLFNSARAHLALGQGELAREHLINALALEPGDPVMLATLVELERRAGRLDAASQALTRLERAAPQGDPRVALLRGEVLLAQDRLGEAAEAFVEAQRLGGGERAVIGLYETRRRGDLPDPAAPLNDWLRDHPEDLAARSLLAEHFLSIDDQPAAIREYEKLNELAPETPLFLNNLAWLYGESGDDRALPLARRAHELLPDNPMIADTYGWILHQRGENTASLEQLTAAVAGAPAAGDVRYRYAVVLAATGDRAGAMREAQAVLADTDAASYHEPAQELLNQLERDR